MEIVATEREGAVGHDLAKILHRNVHSHFLSIPQKTNLKLVANIVIDEFIQGEEMNDQLLVNLKKNITRKDLLVSGSLRQYSFGGEDIRFALKLVFDLLSPSISETQAITFLSDMSIQADHALVCRQSPRTT